MSETMNEPRPRRPAGILSRLRGAISRDARLGQIVCLSTLLGVGLFWLDFRIPLWQPPAIFATALAVQWIACRLLALRFDPLSPLITAFSLTFLLRAEAPWIVALAAAIAIGTKFVLRIDGRHVFNPANLGLVLVTLSLDAAWISPGQWGTLGLWAILLAAAGATVAGAASRLDSALGFLGAWTALLFGRALWFGDPMAIPLHQLQSGAILIFAFFMISDPATTPRTRPRRLVHAAAVAGLGFWLQMEWLSETGPIHALILLAPLAAWADARLHRRRAAAPFHSPTDREIVPCPYSDPTPVAAPAVPQALSPAHSPAHSPALSPDSAPASHDPRSASA